MRCGICSRDGANASGFHPECFTQRVKARTGTTATRFEFATGRVVYEDRAEPSTVDEWQSKIEEEVRKTEEARRQEQEEEAKQQAKTAKEREERERRYRETQERRRQSQSTFNSFFSGFGKWPSWMNEPVTTEVGISVIMGPDRIMQLLRLCHPDKHENSELATEITRWLLDIKGKLDKMEKE